jgi:hypothetical protein
MGWTHPFAPLGTPLVDRDDTAAVVASFLGHVAADAPLPKIVLLPLLVDSGPVAQALRATVERSGGAHEAFGRHQRAALQRRATLRTTSNTRSGKNAARNSSACAAASPRPDRSHSRWRTTRLP